MSNKFEELLDLLVNEEMDKANELFHEIVVEKSREIYENMIAEEAEEEVEEASEEGDDAVEEAMDDEDDDMEESIEEETTLEIGGDAGDDFVADVEADEMGGDDMEMGGDDMPGDLGTEGEGSEEERIADLEDALEELKAEFEALMAGEKEEPEHQDMEMGDEEGEEDEGDEEEGDEEDEGNPFAKESVREYVEKVSDGHGVEKKGRGETADNTKSPVSAGKGKPTTGATAGNILGSKVSGEGTMDGTSPNADKGSRGLVGNTKGDFTKGVEKNISSSSKSSFGNGSALNKNSAGHGAERKGGAPGPVGSGKGDKAGQTSVGVVKSPLNGAPNRNA